MVALRKRPHRRDVKRCEEMGKVCKVQNNWTSLRLAFAYSKWAVLPCASTRYILCTEHGFCFASLFFRRNYFLCFALHCIAACSLLVHILPRVLELAGGAQPFRVQTCGSFWRWLDSARGTAARGWASDICDQYCFDFGLKLPQNLWNVFVFVSASVLLKTAIKLGEKGKSPKKLKTGTFPTARQNAMLLDLDLDRLKHQTCNHSFQT